MNKPAILAAYNWRHACKEFDGSRTIKPEDFEFLLEIIRLSPSSFGLQPYEVFVLRNKELLAALHPQMWGAQKSLLTASEIVLFATKKDITIQDNYFDHIVVEVQQTPADLLEMRRNLINNHQLNEIGMTRDPRYLDEWAARQAYIALGNLMSAAAEIGIDSCPIEGFLKAEVTQILEHYQVCDSKLYQQAVFCALGYRVVAPARPKTRKPLAELVHIIE